jgi:serine/threonine-protein kinase haspin
VLKLLHAKRLKAPGVSKSKLAAASSGYTERECYEALVEVEGVLGKCIEDLKKRKNAKKTIVAEGTVGPTALRSAVDVVRFGAGKGWVR